MQTLRDKARDLVSVAEAEIEKREITIVGLKRELASVKEALALAKDRRLLVRSEKCGGCVYKIVALQALAKEEAGSQAGAGRGVKKAV